MPCRSDQTPRTSDESNALAGRRSGTRPAPSPAPRAAGSARSHSPRGTRGPESCAGSLRTREGLSDHLDASVFFRWELRLPCGLSPFSEVPASFPY